MGNTMLVRGYTLVSNLNSFLGTSIHGLEALGSWFNPSQQQSAKPHFQTATGQGFEPHRPPRYAGGDKEFYPLPVNGSPVADPPIIHARIVQILGRAFIAVGRGLVNLRRAFQAQGFVRTFLVELLPPQIQGGLFGRARLQFPADVSMQPFVPAIVLRMAGPTALQINPQGHPPGRQPAQSQQPTYVSKGTAVVAPDGSGQSITFKQSLETLANRGGGRIGQAPQFQDVTAVFVPDRQGFASLSLPVIPPAFEVDGPHFIGGKTPALAPQSACFSGGPPAAARFGQSRPLQDPFETALRSRRAMAPQIQLPQLACSPMSVGQFEPYDFTHHRFAQLAGVTVRPTRLVRHAVDSP